MNNLEIGCKWHFGKQNGGREDGPNNPMQNNFKKSPYASLIRESIQNSLDVPIDDSLPVKMEFTTSRIRAKEYENFFKIKKHIKGCLSHFNDNQDAKDLYQPMLDYLNSLDLYDSLNYIKISDYNTCGMEYLKGNTSNAFYAFVKSAGVSAKDDTSAGGSFGYGKAAYFYISPLRTIFVSTMTKDGRQFFEGVSSLCTHNLEGEDELRVSVGYYDNNNGEPITNPSNIPIRFQRFKPGTDIYIIGVSNKDLIYKEMVEAVLRNFWLAIYEKKLEVTINQTEINYETLSSVMEKYFPEECDTANREKGYNPRPYLDAVKNVGIDSSHILIEDTMPTIGHVCFYAVKNKKAIDKVLYMRKPLMLVKAKRTQSSSGFYGVFICDDRQGNKYLRKTENPAHNEWNSSNWREKGRINPKAREAIKDVDTFVISIMEKMFSGRDKNVQNIQGLNELLYIPTAVEDDDDFENESLIGDIIGQKDTEGSSLSAL